MAIQVLPPQLANQIAAGEVVERPASVVKELVENSLDAGATRVDVEIERGGSKKILIRDNGNGIAKEQLSLALARHATSKVATLAELESIQSFGFRGEALASISSVARLTLSSRPKGSDEAWQAHAEGRDMAVRLNPTAHPTGTSVEVEDLFFNTPARRRFLKADKTEFTHIEEQLRRIALAQEGIHFSLRHNGKLVRQYRPANNERQRQQRIASICGSAFAARAVNLVNATDTLSLHGYLALDDDKAKVSDVQYFYVNGRVVRDRLVNHAVRQALEESGFQGLAGFVLYLSLDPKEVDVNVHPAKHEVRFHQSRYVHDFILQALLDACRQHQTDLDVRAEPVPDLEFTSSLASPSVASTSADSNQRRVAEQASYHYSPPPLVPSRPSAAAVRNYGSLLNTTRSVSTASEEQEPSWHWLSMLDTDHGLIEKDGQLRVIQLQVLAARLMKSLLLERLPQGLIGQPLLLPVSLSADAELKALAEQHQQLLRRLGIELGAQAQRLVIRTVPEVLRQADLSKVIMELLQWLQAEVPENEALAAWLCQWYREPQADESLWARYTQMNDDDSFLAEISYSLNWRREGGDD